MHESLNEFKFQPDTTTNSRVICPCASEKLLYNVVNTLATLFFITSSSFLQVTRTTIKSWTSSKFGRIGPRTAELAALERLEKSPSSYNGRNLVNTLAPSFLILAGNEDMHESLDKFEFRQICTELRPLIDVRIKFLPNILKTDRPMKTTF